MQRDARAIPSPRRAPASPSTMFHGVVQEHRPPERSGLDRAATAGRQTAGLSVARASVSSDMCRLASVRSSLVSSIRAQIRRVIASSFGIEGANATGPSDRPRGDDLGPSLHLAVHAFESDGRGIACQFEDCHKAISRVFVELALVNQNAALSGLCRKGR